MKLPRKGRLRLTEYKPAVLNFMYHGEVNVAQEELNSFLSVAEDLQVKGLTQGQDETPTQKTADKYSQPKPVT